MDDGIGQFLLFWLVIAVIFPIALGLFFGVILGLVWLCQVVPWVGYPVVYLLATGIGAAVPWMR